MKLHRFIGAFDLNASEIRLTDSELINQLMKVLRIKIGEQIVLCDGKGCETLVTIENIDAKAVLVIPNEKPHACPEPARRTSLYCSIIKRENFDIVVQKAVEVGVWRIIPVVSRRTVKLELKTDRLKKIMKEAAELSGRGFVPALNAPITFADALKDASSLKTKLMFESRADPLENILASGSSSGSAAVLVGPEGGWDQEEVHLAEESGFVLASMGDLTFRAETAAIIATYLLCHTN
jgi:16S rRNA (uracil1498-N3)-methyltransferase